MDDFQERIKVYKVKGRIHTMFKYELSSFLYKCPNVIAKSIKIDNYYDKITFKLKGSEEQIRIILSHMVEQYWFEINKTRKIWY